VINLLRVTNHNIPLEQHMDGRQVSVF
jgi:hypothetical protein